MDLDGIDAAFLYPSMGLFAGAVHDPQLASALWSAAEELDFLDRHSRGRQQRHADGRH
jgi:hypothetical protein